MSAPRPALTDALVKRACELNQTTLSHLDQASLDADQVHQVRIATKELRSFWQLVRDIHPRTAADANRQLARAARSLGSARDFHVMQDTLSRLARRSRRPAEKRALEEALSLLFVGIEEDHSVAVPDGLADALKADLTRWQALKLKGGDGTLVDKGLRRSWKKIRQRMLQALDSDRLEDWHSLRKWIKYLGYQLALLERAGLESPVEPDRIKEFGRDLGRLHDLHVLISHTKQQAASFPDEDSAGYCIHLLRRHESSLLQHCAASAVHLTQLKPGALGRAILAQLETE